MKRKKVLIILLALILLTAMTACMIKSPEDKDKDPSTTQAPDQDGEKTGIGQVTISKDGIEQYSLVINSIRVTEERNPFWAAEPEQVIIIDYTYENLGSEESVHISFANLYVVDSAGNQGFLYPATEVNKEAQEIGIGEKCNAEEAYGLKVAGGTIRIELHMDLVFNLDPEWVFEYELKE